MCRDSEAFIPIPSLIGYLCNTRNRSTCTNKPTYIHVYLALSNRVNSVMYPWQPTRLGEPIAEIDVGQYDECKSRASPTWKHINYYLFCAEILHLLDLFDSIKHVFTMGVPGDVRWRHIMAKRPCVKYEWNVWRKLQVLFLVDLAFFI